MKKYLFALAIMLVLAGESHAVLRNGSIQGRDGLYYGFMAYSFGSVDVTITNRNNTNAVFGGTMIFLDKNYRVIARAELRQATISRRSSKKYKAFFSYGSGNEAQAAKYIRWEF